MVMTLEQAQWFAETFTALVGNIERSVMGRGDCVRLAVTCLLAEGHLLLEDFPGTGKTTLARAMAQSIQGTYARIQFTPDLLPSDVTGVTIYDQRTLQFDFHPGPVFASIVVADEINRASPKTQSALLEVMEEARVTVDGTSYAVPGSGPGEPNPPFMVIATQNPIEQAGTYRLPEAQLDRFLMKLTLGYPDADSTVRILASGGTRPQSPPLAPVLTTTALTDLQRLAQTVHVEDSVLAYVTRLLEESRTVPDVRLGASVRGGLALVRAARVRAATHGRPYVVPDDVKMLAECCLAHRIVLDPEAEFNGVTAERIMRRVLTTVPPPMESAPA